MYNSASAKMRHDAIEQQLHETIRDGVELDYRQQHGLLAADRTVPDLLIRMDCEVFLCDVTVAHSRLSDVECAIAARLNLGLAPFPARAFPARAIANP